jgi:hypothetical protein
MAIGCLHLLLILNVEFVYGFGSAARLLGIDDRTSRRWAQNGVNGGSAQILLRLLLAGRITCKPPYECIDATGKKLDGHSGDSF